LRRYSHLAELDTLDQIRHTIGEYNFAGQYQQSPAPLGGGMVKKEWFKFYGEKDRPESFDLVVQSWDTANKATELSDFSVCTTWGIKGKNLYLLSVLRKRLEYPDLKRAVREQQRLFNANVVLIEELASGTQLIQELIVDGCYAVKSYKPECDKVMRLHGGDREWLCLCPANRTLARRVPPRNDGLPQGQA
jgi:phage terminase large subunit-like protein